MPEPHTDVTTPSQRVEQRRAEIVQLLEETGIVGVTQLAERYGISQVTVRGDLDALESRGKLRRVHGGAMPLDRMMVAEGIETRMATNPVAKRQIARAAARMVNEGDTLFVDTGTTNLELMRALVSTPGITVITHDSVIGRFVMERMPLAELVIVGGRFRKGHGYCTGSTTMQTISKIYADKSFVATDSFSQDQGFMCSFPAAGDVKAGMLAHAERSFILMDSSKFGKHNYLSFATLADVDCIITEADPNDQLAQLVRAEENPPELVIA